MLQAIQKKVTLEGESEEKLYDKFVCYCKTGGSTLAKSIADAEAKAPQVVADIEAGEAEVKQLKADIKSLQADRAAAKEAMASATTIRCESEAKQLKADIKSNQADRAAA